MLQIKNLCVSLKKDLRAIIDGFSFVLGESDRAVIIGEEGNGKSTLLKLIYSPELAESYCEYSGEIITRGVKLGYLPQEMSANEKALAVADFCAKIPEFYDTSPKVLGKLCRELDLPAELPFTEQLTGTLSGGERVKLQLLKILISEPDVLLLDEPSNDIDIATLEWLERFINGCGKPVLFVSHDETLIENTANVIIHLEQIRRKTLPRASVVKSSYTEYINSRSRALDKQEQDANKEKAELNAKLVRFRRIEQSVEHAQNVISRQDPGGARLLKKKMHAVKSLEKRIDRESEDMTERPDIEEAIFLRFDEKINVPNGKTVAEFELPELTLGETVLARDIHLTVKGAEKVCITGRNGIGKTTLLKKIAESLFPRRDIVCGYMPQDYFDLLPMDRTPVEYLAPSGRKEDTTRAMTMLGSVKYTADEMAHSILELSGGQKAKLVFLKLTSDGCNVLLLDEPTRNFSPMSNPVIREILRNYGGAIISVSHDRRYISEVCGTVYELTENGLSRK
ncbi:MAG: ATP-binding cassette domain-containing protein [Oscillospiraceae bacterium]|nr:ATP-binding cassette domain-containing protein [Oscillospiraceae bacterium]